ncbi:MAG: hypothetical protein POH28_13265 [Acidocella sp.]|nr:hypothetical protein [Acidocella sp.]
MIDVIFIVPVGPNDAGRVGQVVRSIVKFCTNYRIFILLDGVERSALSADLGVENVTVVTHPTGTAGHWGKIWLRQCLVMIDALKIDGLSDDAIFVKIDADALIVRPGFVERAQAIFRTRPRLGQIGQCYSNIIGERLHNHGWYNFFAKMTGWRGFVKFIRYGFRTSENINVAVSRYLLFRQIIEGAEKNGYSLGDFAIGGCYILRKAFIVAMSGDVLFGKSPFLSMPTIGEDVLMTPYLYYLGFSALDDTANGGIFAIEGKEFRLDPFSLKQRGHYIVHPVKYGYRGQHGVLSETELVDQLTAES